MVRSLLPPLLWRVEICSDLQHFWWVFACDLSARLRRQLFPTLSRSESSHITNSTKASAKTPARLFPDRPSSFQFVPATTPQSAARAWQKPNKSRQVIVQCFRMAMLASQITMRREKVLKQASRRCCYGGWTSGSVANGARCASVVVCGRRRC